MKPAIQKNILQRYNPDDTMFELINIKTLPQCLSSKTPALAELKRDSGEEKVLTLLEMWILDVNKFFNMNNKMSPVQIKQTALMVLQDFYYFKIADINYLFTQAKKGKYGEMYGSLDGSKIYRWFESHDIERSEEKYFNSLKQHDIEMQNERNAKVLDNLPDRIKCKIRNIGK